MFFFMSTQFKFYATVRFLLSLNYTLEMMLENKRNLEMENWDVFV